MNANWQECQQNWNKAQTAWGRGDYGRAVAYATGFNSDLTRAAGWVNDNNRDWDILRDPGCSETVREAAGKRIFGRGFELAGWLVGAGIGAKNAFGKARLSEVVLAEAEEEELSIPASRIRFTQPKISWATKGKRGVALDTLTQEIDNGYFRGTIDVVQYKGQLYSLDNRRLAAFKLLDRDVPVTMKNLRDPLVFKEFRKKFNPIDNGLSVWVSGTDLFIK